ncbi:MAG TPA: sugar ABC transporter permease [Acidimicrobiales bacterium]|nr:sugar ABC transporter permease [Acidimicrobiales bacterium]
MIARQEATVSDSGRLREALTALAFIAPSLVVFWAFSFYPFQQLILRGLYRNNASGTNLRWVGWEQYGDVLAGNEFRDGLWHSMQFVLFTVPAGLVLGTVLAVAANRRLRGIKVFQTIFSSTIATSTAVASVVFLVLINQQIGVYQGGVPGFGSQAILENPSTAMFGVSLSAIWQNLGLSFVIVLAGLQAIPQEVEEAATLDGYGPVRRFFRITLPMISPVLLFLVVVLVIFALQAFAPIELLTSGGPARSTETLVYKIFERQTPDLLGEGAVLSVGLFGVTFLVTLGQFLLLERRVHYGS